MKRQTPRTSFKTDERDTASKSTIISAESNGRNVKAVHNLAEVTPLNANELRQRLFKRI